MRTLILFFLFSFSLHSWADDQPIKNEFDEPEITIIQKTDQTVEEYRANGKLYMIKITPKHGVPYYLIDENGDGQFIRRRGTDTGLSVPMWTIKRF